MVKKNDKTFHYLKIDFQTFSQDQGKNVARNIEFAESFLDRYMYYNTSVGFGSKFIIETTHHIAA